MTQTRLAIVTLTKDNLDELEVTLKSVFLQKMHPSLHLVVDSSAGKNADRACELALNYGASYHWIEPIGIYPAMEASLSFLGDSTYVMWLNSSDWLVGPESVSQLQDALSQNPGVSWLTGELLRREASRLRFHRTGADGAEFLRAMNLGFTGFPHPSTVFNVEKITTAGGYRDGMNYRVANDYDLALRFGRLFGPPLILRFPISFQVPDGFSAEHKVLGHLERTAIRLRRAPLRLSLMSLALLGRHLVVAILRDLGILPLRRNSSSIQDVWSLSHFCSKTTDQDWPTCCDQYLGVRGA